MPELKDFCNFAEEYFENTEAAQILYDAFSNTFFATAYADMGTMRDWLAGYPECRQSLAEFMSHAEKDEEAIKDLDKQELKSVEEVLKRLGQKADAMYATDLRNALQECGLVDEHIEYRVSLEYMRKLFENACRGGKYSVASSNGEVRCDSSGLVVGLSGDWEKIFMNGEETGIPLKFDLPEYQEYWQEELPNSFDILDLGFACHLGINLPPEMEWRESIKEEMEDEKSDIRPF